MALKKKGKKKIPLFWERFPQDVSQDVSQVFLWEFLPIYPVGHLWGQALTLDEKNLRSSSSQRFDGIEIKALYVPVKFFHIKLLQPMSLWTLLCPVGHSHAGIKKGPPTGSIALSKMSCYAAVLGFPFTGSKGPIVQTAIGADINAIGSLELFSYGIRRALASFTHHGP